MATIEPWLTNLLNKPRSPDLPPIQTASAAAANQPISLPPLGPEFASSTHRPERPAPVQGQIAPLSTLDDGGHHGKPHARPEESFALHTASIRPLQLLLREPDQGPPAIPLRSLVTDAPGSPDDTSTKKRHRAFTTKEDFVQLPKLPKKQKSAQQVVPPIIAGLHEPPPNAGVFPPITSTSFDNDENFSLAPWKDTGSAQDDRPVLLPALDIEPNEPSRPKRRPMKPRRKWTEEETNNLLLGVSRHGVGRWTTILEDPAFHFNCRTAGDLKDRFRTCCPKELRLTAAEEQYADEEPGPVVAGDGGVKHKIGLQLEDILQPIGDDSQDNDGVSPSATGQDSDAGPKKRKPRAHRRKMEDLVELGIHGPFEKSHRRKRRPFTKQDDEEILDGLHQYGPSWTRIQRDPKYNLSSRQPTDLRDRVRNKYPDVYANIEKANMLKEVPRGKANLLEPSINMATEGTRITTMPPPFEPSLNRSGSREEMLVRRTTNPIAYESAESLPALAELFDMSEPHGPPSLLTSAPEMDISHLLLDDSHTSTDRRLGHGR